jgi:hypothetical protein
MSPDARQPSDSSAQDNAALLCHRCGCDLMPGSGNFYQVRIEAVADPYPPQFDTEDLEGDLRGQIDQLLAQMEQMSPQELMDQVHRSLVLHLCGTCYREWIEDPCR